LRACQTAIAEAPPRWPTERDRAYDVHRLTVTLRPFLSLCPPERPREQRGRRREGGFEGLGITLELRRRRVPRHPPSSSRAARRNGRSWRYDRLSAIEGASLPPCRATREQRLRGPLRAPRRHALCAPASGADQARRWRAPRIRVPTCRCSRDANFRHHPHHSLSFNQHTTESLRARSRKLLSEMRVRCRASSSTAGHPFGLLAHRFRRRRCIHKSGRSSHPGRNPGSFQEFDANNRRHHFRSADRPW